MSQVAIYLCMCGSLGVFLTILEFRIAHNTKLKRELLKFLEENTKLTRELNFLADTLSSKEGENELP